MTLPVATTLDETIALVTLSDARSFTGKAATETLHDDIISLIIEGVSQDFHTYVGRRLLEQTETTVYLDGNGEEKLILPRYPNITIATVTEDDVALTEGEDEDFRIYSDEGFLVRLGCRWSKGHKNIVLTTYKAGYTLTTLPKDIKLAALTEIARRYQEFNLKSWGELSRSMGDGSSSKRDHEQFLPGTKAVLARYRDIRV